MCDIRKKFFDKIFESSSIAIGIANLEGFIIDANEACFKLTGYTKNELLQKRYQDITPPEFHSFDEKAVNLLLKHDRSVEYEKEWICKDGTRVPILLNSVCIKNEKGVPIALAGTVQAMTQYKSYLNEIKDYKNKLSSHLDITNEVICELNSDYRFLSLSHNSTYILSYKPSELIDRCLFDYIHTDDLEIIQSIFRNSLRNYSSVHFSFRFRTIEGKWLLRECSIIPYRISSGGIRFLMNFNHTAKNFALNDRVFKQRMKLKKLDENLDQRINDLEILFEVVKAVNQSLELEEIYRVALDMIIKLDNVDMVFLYLLDKDGKEAFLETYRNVPKNYVRRVSTIPHGIGLTWKIIENGKLFNIEDIQYNDDIGPGGKELGHHGLLGAPLTINDKVIGVLYFASYKYRKFDQNEVSLFSSISYHLSIAISKANLYEELKESEKKYRELYENVPVGIYRKSLEGQILMANPTLIQMLGFCSLDEMTSTYRIRSDFHTDAPAKGFKKLVKKSSEFIECESTWQKKDGSPINVIESVRKIVDQNGNFLYYEGTATNITKRKIIENKLKKSQKSLRMLTKRIEQYREEERTEVAREIHDEFAQILTGMNIDVSWLKKRINRNAQHECNKEIADKIDDFSVLLNRAFDTVKNICGRLRPRILDDLGIEAAINWQIDNLNSLTDIDFEFNSSIDGSLLNTKIRTAVFRIFQESLTNIIRHAEATKVNVSLQNNNNNIVMTVKDNGKGMTEDSIDKIDSLGLLGMRERAKALYGDFEIKSTLGKGTLITVRIPYDANLT